MLYSLVFVIASATLAAEPKPFVMLTDEGIARLPAAERAAWGEYLAKSRAAAEKERSLLAGECRQAGMEKASPAPGNRKEFEFDSGTPTEWFGKPENVRLAEVVISYQTPSGGWSKAVDYSKGARPAGTHWTSQTGDAWHYCGTFDNRSTTEQIKFLAGVYAATARDDVRTALDKGIEYLFDSQYPNGGWPQNYPVERGYHEAITLNDDAMTHVLEVLLAMSRGEKLFAFADEKLKARARGAFERGLSALAAMQIRVDGRPTVWCAQHHPLTLEPVGARAKEPPSFSGGESANLAKFLMRSGPLTAETKTMVEAALAWFESHRIGGLRKTKNAAGKTDYVADADSPEVYWARFYDLHTGKPVFAGADDGIRYDTYGAMAAKNKVAYDYFTTRPGELLEKERVRWKKRWVGVARLSEP